MKRVCRYFGVIPRIMKGISIFVFQLLVIVCQAQFVHPGMLHSKADLDFMRKKVTRGVEPWKSEFEALKGSEYASLDYVAKPVDVVVVGYYSKPDIGASDFHRDGDAAYTLALRWYVSREKAYAEKSIAILNAWSHKLDSVTNDNRKLLIGYVGIKYLNAAEIIKHTYKKWNEDDQKAFEHMLLDVWYPVIESFQPNFNGNWDAAIIQTMMCMGIFLDRQDIFDKAYTHCLSGETNGAIDNYYNESGQCEESGRDQGHAQMGLGFMSDVCEVAWKQGKDLYSAYGSRLALGFEYTAKYMVGEEVPYVPYKTYEGKIVFGESISSQGRGRFSPAYERGYHHYHDRMGMEMPYTKQALERSRPERNGGTFMPWATLTSEGYPSK
jgi:Alginate lyase